MKCSNCGTELEEGVFFCRECGHKVASPKRFCRECGTPLASGAKFCESCGAKVDHAGGDYAHSVLIVHDSDDLTESDIPHDEGEEHTEQNSDEGQGLQSGSVVSETSADDADGEAEEKPLEYNYGKKDPSLLPKKATEKKPTKAKTKVADRKKTESAKPGKRESSTNVTAMIGKVKTKAQDKWGTFDLFCKIAVVTTAVATLLLLIALFSGRILPLIISILQIGGIVVAFLLYKGIIKVNKDWIKFAVLAAVIVLALFNLASYSWHLPHKTPNATPAQSAKTKSITPYNAADCIGKDRSVVRDNFVVAGFENVTEEEIADLDISQTGDVDRVVSVTINGVSDFSGNQEFAATSNVIITYHSFKKIHAPISSEEARTTNTDTLLELFKNAGFTNINVSEEYDLDPDMMETEQEISVSINGTDAFDKVSEFPVNSKVDIVVHFGYTKHTLNVIIDFTKNLFFSTYNVTLKVDGQTHTMTHGTDSEFEFALKEGTHTITFINANDSSIKQSETIELTDDMEVSYKISCHSERIDVEQLYLKTIKPDRNGFNEATNQTYTFLDCVFSIPDYYLEEPAEQEAAGSYFYAYENDDLAAMMYITGDTDVSISSEELDVFLTSVVTGMGEVNPTILDKKRITFLGMQSIEANMSATISERDCVVRVLLTDSSVSGGWFGIVLIQTDNAPYDYFGDYEKILETAKWVNGTPPTNPETEQTLETTPIEPAPVYYSTNDLQTAKKGNSGVFAYKKSGVYDIYQIIDFDEGYVYYFTDGNGNEICDKVKIVSGDLNNVVIITYHDGGTSWSEGLHFKWVNQPDHLVVEDSNHFEWDYYATNLNSALSIRNTKTIRNY